MSSTPNSPAVDPRLRIGVCITAFVVGLVMCVLAGFGLWMWTFASAPLLLTFTMAFCLLAEINPLVVPRMLVDWWRSRRTPDDDP